MTQLLLREEGKYAPSCSRYYRSAGNQSLGWVEGFGRSAAQGPHPPALVPRMQAALRDEEQGSEDVQPPESGKQLCLFTALRRAVFGWKHPDM